MYIFLYSLKMCLYYVAAYCYITTVLENIITRGIILLPVFYCFAVSGLTLRHFTTVPCKNTSSLPSEVRLFGADTG